MTFGEDFERNYMKEIFDLQMGMTQAISHFSRFEDAAVDSKFGKYTYTGAKKKTALTKIKMFYDVTIFTLLGSGVAMFIFTANFGHPHIGPQSQVLLQNAAK